MNAITPHSSASRGGQLLVIEADARLPSSASRGAVTAVVRQATEERPAVLVDRVARVLASLSEERGFALADVRIVLGPRSTPEHAQARLGVLKALFRSGVTTGACVRLVASPDATPTLKHELFETVGAVLAEAGRPDIELEVQLVPPADLDSTVRATNAIAPTRANARVAQPAASYAAG
jgi:hypothetical protein